MLGRPRTLLLLPLLLASTTGPAAGLPGGDITPVHDPSRIAVHGGTAYLFSTSYGAEGGIEVRRTSAAAGATGFADAVWRPHSTVFPAAGAPSWIHLRVPKATNLWAPDISQHESTGVWRLYYAASSFGSATSCIGLATTADFRTWTDRGAALCTEDVCPPAPDPSACNAIDPHAFTGAGRSWMVFGSFWSGIKLVELNATSGLLLARSPPLLPDATETRSASSSSSSSSSTTTSSSRSLKLPRVWPLAENLADPQRSIEAAWLEPEPTSGWHFLFVNWGFCCRGVNSTYHLA